MDTWTRILGLDERDEPVIALLVAAFSQVAQNRKVWLVLIHELLGAVWPERNYYVGNLTFWFYPSKKSAHIALPTFWAMSDEDLADLHRDNENGENVYFGLGLRRPGLPAKKQGGKKDIVALPGFAIDIDKWNEAAHVAKNLPRTDEDAFKIISGGPDPSIIINSGNGWHCHYLFDEPQVIETTAQQNALQKAYKAFQKPFVERAANLGWHLDNTASIQRVWRVPGFKNCKNGTSVEILHLDSSIRYPFESLSDITIPEKRHTKAKPVRPAEHPTVPPDFLNALVHLNPENRNKTMVNKVLVGESFAEPGERDEMMQRVCSTMAWVPAAKDLSAQEIAEVLRPSLQVWAGESDADKDIDDELGKAIDKIERAQQDQLDKREEQWKELAPIAEALRSVAAESQQDSAPKKFLEKYAIVQFKSGYWVFDFRTRKYAGPRTKEELLTYARDAWKKGPSSLQLDYFSAKGSLKQKTAIKVVHEYCTVSSNVIGQFFLEESYLDLKSNTFYEAVAPLRKLKPEHNKDIAAWLELLCGDQLEKVLDWIAAVPQLERQCCVLYLDGVSGAGKGLLAAGLSRLWHAGGATPLVNVLGDFNADMFRCPLLFLDEGLPKQKGNVSAEIRSLIGSSSFSYKEKYTPNRTVLGSVRLLVAANNDNVLSFGDERMSVNDLEAYIGRFLHVRAQREAATWLEENNVGNALTETWVAGDLLAKHCLYLAEHRKIVPGKRFLVEGDKMDDMHRKLVMQGEQASLIYEWLARFASNPEPLYRESTTKQEQPLALIGNDRFLINTQGVIDYWGTYMGDERRPRTGVVGNTLRKLSEGVRRLGPRGRRKRFHLISFDLVFGWAIDNQIGDECVMENNFASSSSVGMGEEEE